MRDLLWRILIAVFCVAIVVNLLPPLLRIVGLDLSADVWLVVRLCIGGLAVIYVIGGTRWFPPSPPAR